MIEKTTVRVFTVRKRDAHCCYNVIRQNSDDSKNVRLQQRFNSSRPEETVKIKLI